MWILGLKGLIESDDERFIWMQNRIQVLHSPTVTARLLSLVRYSTQGATVKPDPSSRTLCLIGTETFGPSALALASSCLHQFKQTTVCLKTVSFA